MKRFASIDGMLECEDGRYVFYDDVAAKIMALQHLQEVVHKSILELCTCPKVWKSGDSQCYVCSIFQKNGNMVLSRLRERIASVKKGIAREETEEFANAIRAAEIAALEWVAREIVRMGTVPPYVWSTHADYVGIDKFIRAEIERKKGGSE